MGRLAKTLALSAGALALAGGGFVAMNAGPLRARLADHRLRSAADDETRLAHARHLVALGEPAAGRATLPFTEPDEAISRAVAQALAEQFAAAPDAPASAALRRELLAAQGRVHAAAVGPALVLVPELLRAPQPDAAERCRDLVRAGLAAPTAAGRIRAVRLAHRSEIALTASVTPLLDDPDAEVRRAAILAVGPATPDSPVVDDETLFTWLHDSDAEVRDLCESALKSRGLDAAQVGFARKLASPSAGDRLQLLLELRDADTGVVRDPGPWLERLSRDAEPAVRAGAARVAHECRLQFAGWAERLATADTDGTVRRLAAYYRRQSDEVREVGYGE